LTFKPSARRQVKNEFMAAMYRVIVRRVMLAWLMCFLMVDRSEEGVCFLFCGIKFLEGPRPEFQNLQSSNLRQSKEETHKRH